METIALSPSKTDFDTMEEAKEAFKKTLGKHDSAIVRIAGRKTLLIGSDCVYDQIWGMLYGDLGDFLPNEILDDNILTDETSRLRDEFIESAKRVYGIDIETVWDEF